jgi:hypothetical protein
MKEILCINKITQLDNMRFLETLVNIIYFKGEIMLL